MSHSKQWLSAGLAGLLLTACSQQPSGKTEAPRPKPDNGSLASQADRVPFEAKIAELEDRIRTLEAKLASVSNQPTRGIPPNPEVVQPSEFDPSPIDDGLHTRNKGMPSQTPGVREPDARTGKGRVEFPDIGGNYFLNGERLPERQCKIIQVDARLIVINEKKESAPAHFDISGTHIL